MIIGIPKEIKNNENRVAITPAGVAALVQAGHRVLIETNAGTGSGFSDEGYLCEGAEIVGSANSAWEADMVVKIKEPISEEYQYFRKGLLLFTYLHLAPEPELTNALLKNGVIGIAYETIQLDNGELPLLQPMSEVAGRMAVQIGIHFLENTKGGKGVLLGGVPGVESGCVTIIGGGIVGINAAKIAIGMGARVNLVDINASRLRYIDDVFQGRVQTLMSNPFNIAKAVKEADLVVGSVLIPGARAPQLVTEEMVKQMEHGSVIVDVAIDQGGSIETIDRITTHDNPTYVKHGIVHYAVANMPGAVARTSTIALTNVTLPFAVQIASKGYRNAAQSNRVIARGINTAHGYVTYKGVAEAHGYEYRPIEELLA